ncbi:acyltransferase domain-containing protein [Streptomyces sp. NPDC001250]|uniref:acyltransferase domain-containing protein n=1 Tax=unclassified Streptomyces TaxID=2593676 RepID=UPI0033344E41
MAQGRAAAGCLVQSSELLQCSAVPGRDSPLRNVFPALSGPERERTFGDGTHPASGDDVRRAQPLIFALDVALGTLLLSWGVRPAAYLGHSAGEYAAAVLAGLGGCAGVYGRIHRPARHWTHPRPPFRCTARLRQLARRHEPASAAPSPRDERARWGRTARIAAVTAA